MSATLADKVFVVTGGFGVLGRRLGEELVQRGARVALLDRSDSATAPTIPGTFALGNVDLSDPEAAADSVLQATNHLGPLDGLVNVAGGFAWEKVDAGEIATWDRMYQTNLRTAVVASQAILPHLIARGAGRIVNIGALASLKGTAGMGAYAASKSGLARFTEALADELKETGITVNAVLPSIIDTPANRADMPGQDTGKWVTPQALAAVIAFLLSDESAPITGACLPVAGRM